jgi:predicted adenine nucleotide alpha hydrolase (AANH) superfamily ATPase
MNKRNYQKELDTVLSEIGAGESPALMLHACCAPCSSYVLEYLKSRFTITLYYYNPNISSEEEYRKRLEEVRRLIGEYNAALPGPDIRLLEGDWEPERFYETVRGLENEPEGGKRCEVCFELRLREAAEKCREIGADYFLTTLTISPLKNAELINSIGEKLAEEYGVKYLPSDFKKKNGYKRSIELSREYDLYRQNYCGCVFSRNKTVD